MTPRLTAAVAGWRARPEGERVEVGDGMTIDADAMCRPGSGWTTRDPDGTRRPMTREECESYATTLRAAVELLGAAGADETGTETHTEETGR